MSNKEDIDNLLTEAQASKEATFSGLGGNFSKDIDNALSFLIAFQSSNGYGMFSVDMLVLALLKESQAFANHIKALGLTPGKLEDGLINYIDAVTPKTEELKGKTVTNQFSFGFQRLVENAIAISIKEQLVTDKDEPVIIKPQHFLGAILRDAQGDSSFACNYFKYYGITSKDIKTVCSSRKKFPCRDANDDFVIVKDDGKSSENAGKSGNVDKTSTVKIFSLINDVIKNVKINEFRRDDVSRIASALQYKGKGIIVIKSVVDNGQNEAIEQAIKMAVPTKENGEQDYCCYKANLFDFLYDDKGDNTTPNEQDKAIKAMFASKKPTILFLDAFGYLETAYEMRHLSHLLNNVTNSNTKIIITTNKADTKTINEVYKYYNSDWTITIHELEPLKVEDYQVYIKKEGKAIQHKGGIFELEETMVDCLANILHKRSSSLSVAKELLQLTYLKAKERAVKNDNVETFITSGDIALAVKELFKAPNAETIVTNAMPKKHSVISEELRDKLIDLPKKLKEAIFHQEHVIDKVNDSILNYYSFGDSLKSKPMASFFFAGPTGVGKTELAKTLAKELGMNLVRLDMSEYSESHQIARLVGSPPGYVDSDKSGLLVEVMNSKPHSILLLDEFEKAHPAVHQAFLQILDYGEMTDGKGQKAKFNNAIIIATSNLGATVNTSFGFVGKTEGQELTSRQNEIRGQLPPELYNRFDSVITFNALDKDTLCLVAKKHIDRMSSVLEKKGIKIRATNAVYQLIVEKSYDAKLGARPIEHFIEQNIMAKLSKEMLFGSLFYGGEVEISVKNGEFAFNYNTAEKPAKIIKGSSKGTLKLIKKPIVKPKNNVEISINMDGDVSTPLDISHC